MEEDWRKIGGKWQVEFLGKRCIIAILRLNNLSKLLKHRRMLNKATHKPLQHECSYTSCRQKVQIISQFNTKSAKKMMKTDEVLKEDEPNAGINNLSKTIMQLAKDILRTTQ